MLLYFRLFVRYLVQMCRKPHISGRNLPFLFPLSVSLPFLFPPCVPLPLSCFLRAFPFLFPISSVTPLAVLSRRERCIRREAERPSVGGGTGFRGAAMLCCSINHPPPRPPLVVL